jgi:thiamine-phosphate pyrophosphorylase
LLLYYISDRTQFPGDEASRRHRLLENIAQAARCGVDYIQLREKDLSARELERLAQEAVAVLHKLRSGGEKLRTGFLINSRTDVALACGADGVHLRSDDIRPAQVRKIWIRGGAATLGRPTVAVSCHAPAEVARAAADGADLAVFGPIFEKKPGEKQPGAGTHGPGLDALHQACGEKIPVLALGGITLENAEACIQAGAAGIAGIRLFQDNEMGKVVAGLRDLKSPAREQPTED